MPSASGAQQRGFNWIQEGRHAEDKSNTSYYLVGKKNKMAADKAAVDSMIILKFVSQKSLISLLEPGSCLKLLVGTPIISKKKTS